MPKAGRLLISGYSVHAEGCGVRLPLLSNSHDRASMPKAGVRLLYFSGSNIHAEGWGASLTPQRHSQDSPNLRIQRPCRRLWGAASNSQQLSR